MVSPSKRSLIRSPKNARLTMLDLYLHIETHPADSHDYVLQCISKITALVQPRLFRMKNININHQAPSTKPEKCVRVFEKIIQKLQLQKQNHTQIQSNHRQAPNFEAEYECEEQIAEQDFSIVKQLYEEPLDYQNCSKNPESASPIVKQVPKNTQIFKIDMDFSFEEISRNVTIQKQHQTSILPEKNCDDQAQLPVESAIQEKRQPIEAKHNLSQVQTKLESEPSKKEYVSKPPQEIQINDGTYYLLEGARQAESILYHKPTDSAIQIEFDLDLNFI